MKLYPSVWEIQRVSLGYNYWAGSYTPVITVDLVVIPQWLVVISRWLVVIPQQRKFKALQLIIKKCVDTTKRLTSKANMKAGMHASKLYHTTLGIM